MALLKIFSVTKRIVISDLRVGLVCDVKAGNTLDKPITMQLLERIAPQLKAYQVHNQLDYTVEEDPNIPNDVEAVAIEVSQHLGNIVTNGLFVKTATTPSDPLTNYRCDMDAGSVYVGGEYVNLDAQVDMDYIAIGLKYNGTPASILFLPGQAYVCYFLVIKLTGAPEIRTIFGRTPIVGHPHPPTPEEITAVYGTSQWVVISRVNISLSAGPVLSEMFLTVRNLPDSFK